MRVDRLPALALALACLCAPAARAGGQVDVAGVRVTVRTPWPDMLDHGAQPFLVDVLNPGAVERRVDLAFTNGFGSRSVRIVKQLVIGAGERTSFEITAPVNSYMSSEYGLEVKTGGERDFLRSLGATKQPEAGVRHVMVACPDALGPGLSSRWTSDLSSEAAPRWTAPPPPAMRHGAVRLHHLGYAGTPTPTPANVVVATFVTFPDLPRRSEAYSSIDAVVIDPIQGAPPPEQMDAIAAYARCGGVVAVLGADAMRVARDSDDFQPWMEDRFRVQAHDGVETWMCGQGLLLVSGSIGPLGTPGQVASLNAAMEQKSGQLSWIPSPRRSRGADVDVKLPGLELPIRTMAVVLIVFSILIGPVNMYLVRRSKKPALLLLTVPAIALVFSLVLFAWGALSQGIDLRAKRSTYTLLDQRAPRSTAVEVREVFAGLAPGALRPGPGASLWPEIGAGNWNEELRLVVDATDGIELGGDYMPVRTPVRQTLLTDRAARARVDVRREGGVYVAQNALGADIHAFTYRAADGTAWSSSGSIPDGGSARLEPGEGDAVARGARTILAAAPFEGGWLPRGAYAATLSECDFVDPMGAEPRDVDSAHCIVGILEQDEAP